MPAPPRRPPTVHAGRPLPRTRPARRRRPNLTGRGRLVVAVLALTAATVIALLVTSGAPARTSITTTTGPTRAGSMGAGRTVPPATPSTTPTASPTATSTGPSAAPSSPPVARNAAGVPVAVTAAVSAAGGHLAVAVYDAGDGRTWSYQDQPGWVEASVAKLSILGAELRAQQAGAEGGDAVAADEAESIENSDNDAAEDLFDRVGNDGVDDFAEAVGAHDMVLDPAGHWGLATSSALAQVAVMRAYAYPNGALTDTSRARAAALFAAVESDQRWGATAGVPSGETVQVKNGWLPHGDGWVVNTVGHVAGGGRDYVVAVMSADNATEQAGIDRLSQVAAAVSATAAVAGPTSTGPTGG